LDLGEAQGRWREVTLEGWIWDASVREEEVDGHDLVVSAEEGENLRVAPNGTIAARLEEGMRLSELERRDRWVRVRRTGWIWQPSLAVGDGGVTRDSEPAGEPAGPASASAAPATDREFIRLDASARILASPAGDTLAHVEPGATVEVTEREGEWARVRIEGWAYTGALAQESPEASVLRNVDAAALAAEPELYRGRVVEWSLQFIALEQAERFRTDFLEGEYFILARGPGDEAGFVYLAVPRERLGAARALAPLQRFAALARVRHPHSPLTDAPVLDLIEILEPAR
ncbi:MAG TPA: SH3 domain-containing protein, partial [Longimicrobiales bacterium]|nr:SH3 domain-containing protein [Longimicrobiales bacterium]